MANAAVHQTRGFSGVVDQAKFSFLERMILRRFHPVSLLFDVVGFIWVTYFLWENQWQNALVVVLAERLLAATIVWRVDWEGMAETSLGKLALLHLHPLNLMVQIAGAAVIVWALWNHSTLYLLAGLSILALGHAFGWSGVNEHFSLKAKESSWRVLS